MPDPQTTGRLKPAHRAIRCAAVVLGLCVSVASASLCRADVDVNAGSHSVPDWQQLDAALTDLDPASQRARQLVPDLIAAARHARTPDVLRQRAVLMLGRIGEPAADAVPVFLELMAEYRAVEAASEQAGAPPVTATSLPSPETAAIRRVWLLKSLGTFGDVANEAVLVLRRDLFDRSRSVDDRVLIADVLGQIGTVAAVTALSDALRDWPPGTPPSEQLVKRTIVDCIGLSGPAGIVGLPSLLRAIEDDDSSIRRKVCEAIALFGPAGELATDALVERLILDEAPAVRDAAADTLAAIGPTSVPVLIRLLKNGEPEIQWRAARSLGKIGSAATAALAALEETVRASRSKMTPGEVDRPSVEQAEIESLVRIEALEAHWRISSETTGIFREVVGELGTSYRQVRIRACRLLIEPAVLPADLQAKIAELASSGGPAARAASYVFRNRAEFSP